MVTTINPRLGPYVLLALTCFVGWLFKAQCGASWSGAEQYITGCYSDVIPFWGVRGVSAGSVPYVEARMEYPVLTGALIWMEGTIVRLIRGPQADAFDFLIAASVMNAALAFVVLWMFERAGLNRARLHAWAAAPVLLLYVGHNWDMLAVALAVAAFLTARRGNAGDAAAIAAMGAAAKLFPVLMLPLLGLGALFKRGTEWRVRIMAAATLSACAVAFWLAVNLPFALANFTNWSEFYTFSTMRGGTAGSTWQILSDQHWLQTDRPGRNLWSFLLFTGGATAIVAAGWGRYGARPWILFTPVLAWFLLTNKIYSPQFDLWLYPFLLLTSRRLWPVAWFAIGDIAAYFTEFWWFAGMEHAWPAATQAQIALAAGFRGAAMLWVIGAGVFGPAAAWLEDNAGGTAKPSETS